MSTQLKIGDWVEVRGKEEILRTLDSRGWLDGMPFMPEMMQFCGKRFQVYKSAHKTCDYSSAKIRSRRVEDTVHLRTQCDGSAHDGCQAGCLLYWKEAWLKPVASGSGTANGMVRLANLGETASKQCTESDLFASTKLLNANGGSSTYICQTTQIPFATKDLEWWDVRQYIEDYRSGNVSLKRVIYALIYSSYFHLNNAGIGIGRPMRWLYNHARFLWRGSKWPRTPGLIPEGQPTPTVSLNLQPGELVRVKSHDEILKTVTTDNLNRGMHWDAELVPYCGGTYRVLKRVTKIIHERTGKMQEMKTPCIILDSVVCQAKYSACRMLCPKEMYPYWREIWLERAGESTGHAGGMQSDEQRTFPVASIAKAGQTEVLAGGDRN
jgi:hypothetical protein